MTTQSVLLTALQFYANADAWKDADTGIGSFPGDAIDYGVTARAALAIVNADEEARKQQPLEYLREWASRMAAERHDFLGCVHASLKARQISLDEAKHVVALAAIWFPPFQREALQKIAAPRRYALLSPQGTACPETVLTEDEYNIPQNRAHFEKLYCRGGADDPVPGTWTDVTDNEACMPEGPCDDGQGPREA